MCVNCLLLSLGFGILGLGRIILRDNNVYYVAVIFLVKIHKVVCGSGYFLGCMGCFLF